MVPSWFRHWFELRQVKQRRPLFIKLDRIALAIVGAVATLAVFWGCGKFGARAREGRTNKNRCTLLLRDRYLDCVRVY